MRALAPRRLAPWSEKLASPATNSPGMVGHQVVIDPEAAHRVVHGRVDSHRHLVGILAGDPLVDLEEIAVLLPDRVEPLPLDGVEQVEIDAVSARPHAAALVADLLGGTRGHVARHQVAEARVPALQEVIALVFGDVVRAAACLPSSWAPRRGRRCGATPTSASASTDDHLLPECMWGESA